MARLPQPGGDEGNWGNLLNEYLSQSLASDGTLKSGVVDAAAIADGSIGNAQLDSATLQKLNDSKEASIAVTAANRGSVPQLYIYAGNLPDSDTLPETFSTGQLFEEVHNPSAGSAMVIRDGTFTYLPTSSNLSACYGLTPDMGAPVRHIGAKFVMTRQNGTVDGVACLAITRSKLNSTSGTLPTATLHFVVTGTNWHVDVIDGIDNTNTGFHQIGSGMLRAPLLEDGKTEYQMEAWIDGTTATLLLPDQTVTTVTDPRFASYAGNYAWFEPYANIGNSDARTGFTMFWADTKSTGAPLPSLASSTVVAKNATTVVTVPSPNGSAAGISSELDLTSVVAGVGGGIVVSTTYALTGTQNASFVYVELDSGSPAMAVAVQTIGQVNAQAVFTGLTPGSTHQVHVKSLVYGGDGTVSINPAVGQAASIVATSF